MTGQFTLTINQMFQNGFIQFNLLHGSIMGRVFAEGEQNNFFSAKDGFLCSFVQRFRIYDPKWAIRSLRVTLGRLKYHYQI